MTLIITLNPLPCLDCQPTVGLANIAPETKANVRPRMPRPLSYAARCSPIGRTSERQSVSLACTRMLMQNHVRGPAALPLFCLPLPGCVDSRATSSSMRRFASSIHCCYRRSDEHDHQYDSSRESQGVPAALAITVKTARMGRAPNLCPTYACAHTHRRLWCTTCSFPIASSSSHGLRPPGCAGYYIFFAFLHPPPFEDPFGAISFRMERFYERSDSALPACPPFSLKTQLDTRTARPQCQSKRLLAFMVPGRPV